MGLIQLTFAPVTYLRNCRSRFQVAQDCAEEDAKQEGGAKQAGGGILRVGPRDITRGRP